jgi:hypothetical protein
VRTFAALGFGARVPPSLEGDSLTDYRLLDVTRRPRLGGGRGWEIYGLRDGPRWLTQGLFHVLLHNAYSRIAILLFTPSARRGYAEVFFPSGHRLIVDSYRSLRVALAREEVLALPAAETLADVLDVVFFQAVDLLGCRVLASSPDAMA